eukprot:s886_g11.t1
MFSLSSSATPATMAALLSWRAARRCRWPQLIRAVAAGRHLEQLEGEIVGFEAATPTTSFLSFRQRVLLDQVSNGHFVVDSVAATNAASMAAPRGKRFSAKRYDAITRGPNNVGAYAWVSRKMRAEKLHRP